MNRLRWALRFNVGTCAAFGALFFFFPSTVSSYLGSMPVMLLEITGAALMFHSLHLLLGSSRAVPLRWEIYYFSAGDILWFLGSVILLVGTTFITTTAGVVATLTVATLVAALGLAQLYYFTGVNHSSRTFQPKKVSG